MKVLSGAILLVCISVRCHALMNHRSSAPKLNTQFLRRDLVDGCEEKYRDSTIDHFSFVPPPGNITTYRQRYYVCTKFWKPDGGPSQQLMQQQSDDSGDDSAPGPIFFYLGNEGDVLLYLNNTGLMWESAPKMGAMLVFAEHRYYGRSLPFGKSYRSHLGYLTAEQAMADYADLIVDLKEQMGAQRSPVIGFGGSYGGMLATWFRIKYPHIMDGAIAGSAPIWVFPGENPAVDMDFFAKGTTFDASEAGGSSAACIDNVKAGWKLLTDLSGSVRGRYTIKSAMSMCEAVELDSKSDVIDLRNWLAGAWDNMAMGNFPYPSSYILNGDGELPAYPVQKACSFLSEEGMGKEALLQGMARAAGVFYNYSSSLACFDFQNGVNPDTDEASNLWGFQYCTEMLMPFAKNGVTDMFWEERWDAKTAAKECQEEWGVTPRVTQANTEWGGRRIQAASNIVFSNGLLDPWHGGGVLEDISDTLRAVIIPEGAHHLDLMFSHPDDPSSVKEVRNFHRRAIAQWVKQAQSTLPSYSQVTASGSGKGSSPDLTDRVQQEPVTGSESGSRVGASDLEIRSGSYRRLATAFA